jgi:tellurite resistance protein
MSAAHKKPTKEKIAEYAEAVRKELTAGRQNEVFRVAVEVGYLAAHADGTFDADEKKAIVDAVEILSQGSVIEWEVDQIVDAAQSQGAGPGDGAARANALGAKLKELGHPDAGLLFGAFVAQATAGIDKAEGKVLRAVGKAAGIADKRVRDILKTVGAESD